MLKISSLDPIAVVPIEKYRPVDANEGRIAKRMSIVSKEIEAYQYPSGR